MTTMVTAPRRSRPTLSRRHRSLSRPVQSDSDQSQPGEGARSTYWLTPGPWSNVMETNTEDNVGGGGEEIPMRCKKCRHILLQHPQVPVEDSHGEPWWWGRRDTDSSSACASEVWYIPEVSMPAWMKDSLDRGDWVKGKILCPQCQGRIGAYSFVTGFKCPCGSRVVPPVHIVKSKVDFTQPFKVSIAQEGSPTTTRATTTSN